LLCRARTGSGKTLAYAVPLIQRLLTEAEARGSHTPLSGLVLVPTKELIVQVHGVISSLLTFCFDVLTAEPLLSGQKYMKAELPTILVTTPSSLLALTKDRQGTMLPLAETLKVLVVDEADLMFSFGYEEDMRAMCVLMPSTYQAMLVSATLSEEVEQLKGLMLHKPVVLKLEEPRVTAKLSQFYFVCHRSDKYLILYTLLKLQLVSGKTLMFMNSIEAAYKMKMLFERFSIPSAVLNAELPHASRQNIISSFNSSLIELLIATDDGFGDEDEDDDEDEDEEEGEEEAPEPVVEKKKKAKKRKSAEIEEEPEEKPAEAEEPEKGKSKLKKKAKKAKAKAKVVPGPNEEEAAEEAATKKTKKKKKNGAKADDAEEAKAKDEKDEEEAIAAAKIEIKQSGDVGRKLGQRRKNRADEQYSLTRGVDLQGVSTVINGDVPRTVRAYVHRVGRCARGGASGTALTMCTEEEEPFLQRIIRHQASSSGSGPLRPLPMQLTDAERFRYRVEDMARGLTKKNVAVYRARELQLEALHSEKLKEYFEDHQDEKEALQRTQRQLREKKSIRAHLKHVPSYLVPEQLFSTATPVQQAVRNENTASSKAGTPLTAAQRRRRAEHGRKQDVLLQGTRGLTPKQRRLIYGTRENMIAKDSRIDPATANLEDLPPLARKKLWKIRHNKQVRRSSDMLGERRKKTPHAHKRAKKFGF